MGEPTPRSLHRVTLVEYPGAQAPDRQRDVVVGGVRIAVHEWGSEQDDPIFLVHGGFDFGRTYDVFAPLLAAAGWRVITWDQRGHGDSAQCALYSLDADLRDMIGVMASTTSRPAVVVGHSKGGAMSVQLADAQPFRFSHFVNIDGLPSRRPMTDLAAHERTRMLSSDITGWLQHRRLSATLERKPDTLDGLARRRGKQNPRLSLEWLRYLVTVGARHDDDGWRWKIDPSMRHGGFGPWRPEWTASRLPGLGMPFLGILAREQEPMGWGNTADDIRPYLPAGGRLELFEDTGHFVHIERPNETAAMILDFLDRGR
ncbi:MAG: alpha/beta fold hydrolase [Actinobacteria bacterium]|uniref:Unannotated protein n=1 Tax=freshwater metagenome TaxID=449393 RepID=A0A6J6S468_9ZZZZ|nr:alpha/beta fold hydrolase [Actinomycetota bacterium]MSW76888.1 alpha/beta fold hydrolase [Actinomycetota bacterium]MSX56938.1 alpha/beta fold hydrolase [Actinomycetota bacterium]MSX92080.1 alpha/beta fold hydrolase [Actinomycetota bacterium]MSZ83478.1 alpha/beta fold hydrolase [Actinomycetota bacterium]